MKFETRDLIAILALGLEAFALWLESAGHPLPEWAKTPLSTVVTVVLGYYFVDSANRLKGLIEPIPPKADAPPPADQKQPGA